MLTIRAILQRHRAWLLPVAMGCAYFAYGWIHLSEYGVTWDEPLHRNWGKIFVLFWQTGDRRFLELMPGHGIDYGPLFYAANYLFSEWVIRHGWLSFVAANHILTLLTTSVAAGLTVVLGERVGGLRSGILAGLSFTLFPFMLAHAHYNPKDIPLMTALLFTAVLFLEGIRRGSARLLLCAALSMGISVAMKVSALLMGPVFAVAYALWLTRDQRSLPLRRPVTQCALLFTAAAFCIGGLYLFWPSSWGDWLLIPRAVQFFLRSDFWPGRMLFLGSEYAGADLPWYYTLYEWCAGTPVLLLVFFGLGMLRLLRPPRSTENIFLLLWFFFPLVFSMKPGLVRYDGVRQFFFTLPAACAIAGIGAASLFRWIDRSSGRRVTSLAAGVVFAELCWQVFMIHPFEGSYRNEVLQTLYPSGMDRVLQIEYWGPSYLQGMDWLMKNAEPNPVICVPTAGLLIEWYPQRDDFTFECSNRTNIIMFFTRYTETGKFADLKIEPLFTIRRMGADLLKIYKI